ncbi:MAG: hypothetical protein ACTSP3_10405, partial [Candidatus Heimdallarchaeaceae archaeon]
MNKETQKESEKPDSKSIEEEYEEHLMKSAKEEEEEEKENQEQIVLELKDIPGLGKKTLDILNENGINNIEQLMTTRLIVLQEMGIQRAIAKKIRNEVAKTVQKYKFFKEE